jgi:arylformamidase
MKTLVSEPDPVQGAPGGSLGDAGGWIDVTVPIRNGMVHWPGNPEVRIERSEKVAADGGISRTSALSLGSHTGTHFDAPSHFGVNDTGVDALPIDALIGPARVVSIEECAAIAPSDLERLDLQPGERLLLKTRNSSCCWRTDQFVTDYVYVRPDAAAYLVERRVRTLGVDYLSVGGRVDGAITHRILLGAGVCVLEGLDLSAVGPGLYDLVALPLRVAGGDGAPARAVLRRR